jgi:hypothetical protein
MGLGGQYFNLPYHICANSPIFDCKIHSFASMTIFLQRENQTIKWPQCLLAQFIHVWATASKPVGRACPALSEPLRNQISQLYLGKNPLK